MTDAGVPRRSAAYVAQPPPPPRFGDRFLKMLSHVGQMSQMTTGTARALFRRPFEHRAIITQLDSLGVASMGIVSLRGLIGQLS